MVPLSHVLTLGFFVIWTWMYFGGESSYYTIERMKNKLLMQPFTSAQNEQSIELERLASPADVYQYLHQVFLPAMTDESLQYNNHPLLGFRLRQLRVMPSSCHLDPLFGELPCFGPYDSSSSGYTEEDSPWIVGNQTIPYMTSDETGEIQFWGQNSWYDGGGYVLQLPLNVTDTRAILRELEDHDFLDEQTRVVFIDFMTYSQSHHYLIQGRIFFEFPSTGGVLPRYDIQTIRVSRYQETDSKGLIAVQIFYLVFAIINVVLEVRLYKRLNKKKCGLPLSTLLSTLSNLTLIVLKVIWLYSIHEARQVLSQQRWFSFGLSYACSTDCKSRRYF